MKLTQTTLLSALIIYSLVGVSHCMSNANDFKGGLFSFNTNQSGIYEIEIGDFTNHMIMAYGDFDGNKYTDMVTVTDITVTPVQDIYINLWQTYSGQFVKWKLEATRTCEGKIMNIIPGDLDYDGKLDLVVVTKKDDDDYCLDFFQSITCNLSAVSFQAITFGTTFNLIKLTTQPMAGDFTGNHFFQLLLFDASQVSPGRAVYEFQPSNIVKLYDFKFLMSKEDCINYDTQVNFAEPHFSSVVDFNGDCRADLVIQTEKGLEFWEKTDTQQYCLVQVQEFGRITSINFADINFDGSVDLVALVQNQAPISYQIVILYNQNIVSYSSLCSKFSKFPYGNISQEGPYVQYQPVNLEIFSLQNSIFTPQIRLADVDWDGKPDALITQVLPRTNTYGQTIILSNTACGSDCSTLSVSNKRYFLQSTDSNFSQITQVEAINSAFFDINEDGKIDFLINTFENGQFFIRCFYNYISTDFFFLKSLGLNGQCTSSACQSGLYYGSSVQCKVTTLDTDYLVATGAALSQSASCSLQLPFVIMGLARTNNYIENFTFGLPQADSNDSTRVWTPIIPNSQLIIFPYSDNTSSWEISIFVQPNDALLIVILVTVSILVILGAVIIYYHRLENDAKRRSQEEFQKMIR